MVDIAHLLRPGHLQQLANILDDPEASANDRFVALALLKNANVAASKVLPYRPLSCAHAPAAAGVAMLVPSRLRTPPLGHAASTSTPTACNPRLRPWFENDAFPSLTVVAPTQRALPAEQGE